MKTRHLLPAPWVAQFKLAVRRIDALPARDRLALFCAVLALLAAAQFLLVQPLQTRRALIEDASVEQAQRQADEQLEAEQARAQRHDELQAQLAQLDRELSTLGAGASSSQSLGFLLNQALARQDVRIVSLREMAVEDLQPPAPANPAPDATAAPAAAAATLYRHRFEVTLGGTPAHLIDALRALDRGARPLRIERVRMSGRSAESVQLSVTLVVIGTERSWLSI